MRKERHYGQTIEIEEIDGKEVLRIDGKEIPFLKTEEGYQVFYLAPRSSLIRAAREYAQTQSQE